ncbi:MAG: acyl-CoA dehydrogenase family protein [Cyanobacteria bacterium P01_G01_bin.19]
MSKLLGLELNWLQEEIKPIANEIDRDRQKLAVALNMMSDRSLLALKVPTDLGGGGMSELEYRLVQVELARVSGALTFLQTQHQSAASMLSKSDNRHLQTKFLSSMATGKTLIGVGFSHLRRRGTPMILAQETDLGYEISGEVPWITGYGFFSHFILGATLIDGRELYGILPFQNKNTTGSITISEPMELMAIASTNTVSAKIERWYLDKSLVVKIEPPGAIHQSSRRNILNHAWYALGCAYAGLDVLLASAKKKQLDFLHDSWQSLNTEVEQCQENAIALSKDDNTSYEPKLELRAAAINLAQRCSQAAIVASSGGANYLHSDAARIYREALLFSVSGQTTDVMEMSIKQLIINN